MAQKGLFDMDLLESIANIQWASTGDSSMALNLSVARLVGDIWERMAGTGQSEIDTLRNETIMRICKYVKDNPRAQKDQLTKEIGKEIQLFAEKVNAL